MKQINKYLIYLGLVLIASGLAYFAFQGFYNRYWSDDWCYDRDFKHLGILKTTSLYFVTDEQAIRGWPLNRYGMTLLSGLVSLPGVFGTQIFTALTIILWLGLMYWVTSNLLALGAIRQPKHTTLLIVGFILYYTFYISTDRFQILYWRSGVVPYSYAIITALTLLGFITSQMQKDHTPRWVPYSTLLVAIFGGGLSEIGSAFLLGGMSLLLAAAWHFKRAKSTWAIRSFSLIQFAWTALLAAFILLIIAPSNFTRYTTMQDGTNNFWLVPSLSIKSAWFFVTNSLITLPIPHLILFITLTSLSMLAYPETQQNGSFKQILWVAGIAFLLIIAIQAPTIYLYKAPPDPRGQSLARFVMLAALAWIGWNTGGFSAKHLPGKWVLLPILFLLAGYAYTARAVQITTRDYAGFVKRAQLWDERDAEMRAAEAQGIKEMEVLVIDTYGIRTKDVMRSQDIGRWVKSCAAGYYSMDAIKAKETK